MIEQRILFKNSSVNMQFDSIAGITPSLTINEFGENVKHFIFTYELKHPMNHDNWRIVLKPDFKPNFHWLPHLTPTDRHVVDQHVFRSPALIASKNDKVLIVIPDLDLLTMSYSNPESHYNKKKPRWYLDLDAPNNRLIVGMCCTRVKEHVLHSQRKGAVHPAGKNQFGFYIIYHEDTEIANNPWRRILEFLWSKWGQKEYENGNPLSPDLSKHVEMAYNWAFNLWKDHVWQEFVINGKKVGAPVFIVNASQSPNYPKPYWEREFRSIWNQAWFCSLRSASGLYRLAKRTNNNDLLEKAKLTKELALSFPQKNGFFPSVIGTELGLTNVNGKKVYRSKSWNNYFWGNSNRNPFTRDARASPYHVLDMSWTALNMLRWHEELERDERLLEYARQYAESLL